ncbi:sulfotransferase family protein [Fodinibius sediminis]|uniref:Sulfotransferase family protein n=1 Tax=Fodinibius sediminis TaxID=1214077 RepID=A0A521EUH0_9BACT|nr:sulfotransferase [Fodinibius sediminis]SMO87588.1 Sulfotransferase family protein [Fodinibius sediminis]
MKSSKILYILGAGRSGSTILATVLNDNANIRHVGELHHFFSYVDNDDFCSCGLRLSQCEYWSRVLNALSNGIKDKPGEIASLCDGMEYHTVIPHHILGLKKGDTFKKYQEAQEYLINSIRNVDNHQYLLDSAKYIGRFLALRRIYGNDVKGIYLVRDVRGVIRSFQKKVQTQSPPFRTLIYYILINFWAQILYFALPGEQIIKVRYEDIVDNPVATLDRIGDFLDLDLSDSIIKIRNKQPFEIPHIVGGNRLKKSKEVILQKDRDWLENMTTVQKVCYYFFTLPLMLINKYEILKK